jgi:hypothetical protein
VIEDPQGIPENYSIKVIYNGIDTTDRFIQRASREFLDTERRSMRLTAPHVRLLASRDNKVQISYKRTPTSDPVTVRYQPPHCNAFAHEAQINSIPDFEVDKQTINSIVFYSQQRKLNPHFVAGLIAQESGFDPAALSASKAIGLTQVTSIGSAEVLKRNQTWPSFPGIEQMSLIEIKFKIVGGEIHSGNEWRLNPDLSIAGGVEYLDYLSDYWNRPLKKALVSQTFKNPDLATSELILASYNSGASRVSDAVEEQGRKWLDNEDLGEAKKYVRRVNSYCDYFGQEGNSP